MEKSTINFLNRIVIVDTKKNINSFGDLELIVKAEVRGQKCETLQTIEFKNYQTEGSHNQAYKVIEKEINSLCKIIGASFSGKVC